MTMAPALTDTSTVSPSLSRASSATDLGRRRPRLLPHFAIRVVMPPHPLRIYIEYTGSERGDQSSQDGRPRRFAVEHQATQTRSGRSHDADRGPANYELETNAPSIEGRAVAYDRPFKGSPVANRIGPRVCVISAIVASSFISGLEAQQRRVPG